MVSRWKTHRSQRMVSVWREPCDRAHAAGSHPWPVLSRTGRRPILYWRPCLSFLPRTQLLSVAEMWPWGIFTVCVHDGCPVFRPVNMSPCNHRAVLSSHWFLVDSLQTFKTSADATSIWQVRFWDTVVAWPRSPRTGEGQITFPRSHLSYRQNWFVLFIDGFLLNH